MVIIVYFLRRKNFKLDHLSTNSALLIIITLSLQIPEGGTGDSGRERTKTFTYDFSFYSADTKSPDYVSQEMVRYFQNLYFGLFSC